MTFLKLVKIFDGWTELPIEFADVRTELVKLGFQDEITCVPQDLDPGKLRGLMYQFTKREGVYAEPLRCSLIIFSSRLPPDWQRIVACKELVHVLDGVGEKTKTPEEVMALVDKLLGPLSTEDFGFADVMAAKDRLALYQALLLLFPDDARNQALALLATSGGALDPVADWAVLPKQLVQLAVSDHWPRLKAVLLDC